MVHSYFPAELQIGELDHLSYPPAAMKSKKYHIAKSSLFFVDKLPATQAAFETAVSQQGFKENVTWYNFTDDNLSLLTQQ